MAVKWVTVDAAGGGSGNSRTDSWTIVEAGANLAAGDICYVVHHSLNGDGSSSGLSSYAESSAMVASNSGSVTSGFIYLVGLDSSDNPAENLGDGPVFDYTSLSSGAAWKGPVYYWVLWGIKIINGPAQGFSNFYSSEHILLEASNNGSHGIEALGSYTPFILCRATGNAGYGLYKGDSGVVIGCEAWGNTYSDIKLTQKSQAILNYIKRTQSSYSALQTGLAETIALNTIVAAGSGVTSTGIWQGSTAFQTFFANNISGFSGIGGKGYDVSTPKQKTAVMLQNNFYNNATDKTVNPQLEVATTAVDPDLPDVANNDYSPITSSLQNIAGLGQELSIGAGQGGSGSGGASYSLPLSAYCLGVSTMEMNTIYPGKENAIGIKVYEDGVRRTDLTALTRCRVIFGGVEVDSATTAAAFDLAYDDVDGNDVILLDFGELASTLPEGEWTATIIIYESTRPDGFICEEGFPIRIKTPQTGTVLTS